jgi:hypothetical protein
MKIVAKFVDESDPPHCEGRPGIRSLWPILRGQSVEILRHLKTKDLRDPEPDSICECDDHFEIAFPGITGARGGRPVACRRMLEMPD